MNISQAIIHPTEFISNLLINGATSNWQVLQDWAFVYFPPGCHSSWVSNSTFAQDIHNMSSTENNSTSAFSFNHHSNLWPLNTWYTSCPSYSQDSAAAYLPPHSLAAKHKDLLLWFSREGSSLLSHGTHYLWPCTWHSSSSSRLPKKQCLPMTISTLLPHPFIMLIAIGKRLVCLLTASREGTMLAPDLEQLLSIEQTFSVLNEWTWHHTQDLQLSNKVHDKSLGSHTTYPRVQSRGSSRQMEQPPSQIDR